MQAAWEPGDKGGSVVQFIEETPAISESCMGARGQGWPIQGYKHMPSHSLTSFLEVFEVLVSTKRLVVAVLIKSRYCILCACVRVCECECVSVCE